MIGSAIITLLYLLIVLSLCLERAVSCGGFVCFPEEPILQAGENIAFGISRNVDGDQDVTMVVQINYEGPASDFAWVLPIMFEPQVSVGSDIMFDVLFEESQPIFNLTILGPEGTTCADTRLAGGPCAFMSDMAFESAPAGGPGMVTVLQEDSVGPYDYVLLEPAETEPGLSVFTWLDDNGYDQPLEAFSLIDYYARQDQLFLALRLRKGTETGDIQPIVLDYTMPGEMANVACVPIQLTSIAATPDMPIQTYVLSEGNLQAFPVNYFTVELDDARADWLGCQTSQSCFLNDMRDRLATFLEEEGINGHAFLTEYAGTSSIIGEDSIAFDIDLSILENTPTVFEFLEELTDAGVPGNDLVNTILGRYISNDSSGGAFFPCVDNDNVYTPQFGATCHEFIAQETIANVSALVQELDEAVFAPAAEAQNFVNRFSYLTRFYGQLSPETMDKDPFFAFNSMLPDVSRVRQATAAPFCTDNQLEGLEITVGDTTFLQPAGVSCQQWFANGDPQLDIPLGTLGTVSMATRLTASGYEGEEGMSVTRSAETGSFPPDVIANIVSFMDARVPNQTVPPYTGTFLTGTNGTITTTDDSDSSNITTDTPGPGDVDIPVITDEEVVEEEVEEEEVEEEEIPVEEVEEEEIPEEEIPVEEVEEEEVEGEEGEDVSVGITVLTRAPTQPTSGSTEVSILATFHLIALATFCGFTLLL